jgi:conjugal transfer ATP-binding protein TraC
LNKFKSVCEKIDFWHFEDQNDFMIYSDGSFGVGYKVQGYDIDCKTEEEINSFNQSIENLLLGTEEGLKIQIFYRLTSNVRRLIEKHKNVSIEASSIYQPIINARIKQLNEQFENNEYFIPEIYLFLRGKPLQYKKRKLFEKKEQFEQTSEDEYKFHYKKFYRSVRKIEAALSGMGLKPVQLEKQHWFDLCFEFLNFGRVKSVGHAHFDDKHSPFVPSLASQLALTDIDTYKEGVKIGKYYFQTLTLKTPSEGFTYSAMIDGFTKLPFHFWISQNIEILDQSKEQEGLQLKRRIATSMASGSNNVSDIENESKLADIEDLLRNLVEGSEKLVRSNFTVIVWSESKDELEEKADEVLKAFREMNQAEGVAETLPSFDIFMSSLPGLCRGMRDLKLKSSNVSHLMPLYGPWFGGDNPVCLIPTRENSLFSYAPFEKRLPAWNALTFGGTGAGKSFNVCTQMLSFYGQTFKGKPPKIVWIDNGASSQRLLEVLDGEFIDLNINSGIRINVFDLEDGEELSSEKIKIVLAVLELILKDEDKKGLPKREKALLEQAIYSTYDQKKGKIPVMSDLKKILDNHSDLEMRKFGEILFSWCGNTAYGKMLDGSSNINLSKDLITIEVQGLTNHPELKDIFLLLLTSQFQDEAAKDLARPYYLIVDEAERLLKTEMAKQFVITCYRTWRKYNAGIHCISQNYRDFMSDPEIRDALLPNTTSVFILRQKKIDWKHFQEVFDFNDAELEAVKSIEVVKGSHSEFVLIQDEDMMILKLVPEPLAYWICTSDGNDKAMISEMEQEFPSLSKIEVLEKLAFSPPEK